MYQEVLLLVKRKLLLGKQLLPVRQAQGHGMILQARAKDASSQRRAACLPCGTKETSRVFSSIWFTVCPATASLTTATFTLPAPTAATC